MRESWGKPRKSLCTPRDWNLHPRTSRQTKSRETLKTQILKNILSIFRDWDIDSLVNRKKSLCGLAIRTCDWTNPRLSRQNRATLFLKILTIFAKKNTFQKQLKQQKYFCVWSTRIEHVKTNLIKYNHTNDYGIHWT